VEGGRFGLSKDGQTLAVLPDGDRVVVLGGEGFAKKVWLGLPWMAWLGQHRMLSVVALSPDAHWAATSTWHGTGTRVWDARTGRLARELPGGDAEVAFSPDGCWLVTGTVDEFRSWQVGSWEPGRLRVRREWNGTPGSLAFRADGKGLALADSLREVRLVDPATGQELATLAAPSPQAIVALAFSPDGSRLAAACRDRVVQLWDLRLIRQQLAELHLDWNQP